MATTQATVGVIKDGSITAAKMAANSVDSDSYVNGSIDPDHLADNAVTLAKMASGTDGNIISFDSSGNPVAIATGNDGTPATDHTANGPQTKTFSSGYTTTAMDLVYLSGTSTWLEADSDATGTSIGMLAIALEAIASAAVNVALPGSFVRDDTWSWTPGAQLFVSGTLGAITATAPSGSGDVVRVVGFAVTADVIYFNPSPDYFTVV